jgi:hypothetical protein
MDDFFAGKAKLLKAIVHHHFIFYDRNVIQNSYIGARFRIKLNYTFMFKEAITPFGNLFKYTFADADSGNSFLDHVPGYGACLTDLVFEGKSILDGYATYEELIENKWSKSAFLFPFPNRLRDGVYHFDNVRYQFPVNNPATGNAIHGYGKSLPMEVSDIHLRSMTGLRSGVLIPGSEIIPLIPFHLHFLS